MIRSKTSRWYRPRNVILTIAVLLLGLLLWAGYWIRWAYTAEPTISVDYAQKLIELSKSNQPEGENAWPLLMDAVTQLEEVEREVEAMDFEPRVDDYLGEWEFSFDNVRYPELYPDNIEPERKALELLEKRGLFELLDEARAMPRAVATSYDADYAISASIPFSTESVTQEVGDLRAVWSVLCARMRIDADAGSYDALPEILAQELYLAEAAGAQPTYAGFFTSLGLQHGSFLHLQYCLHEHTLPGRTAEQLRRTLRHIERHPDIDTRIESIRLLVLDLIQRLFTDDGEGDGRFLPHALEQLLNAKAKMTTGAAARVTSDFRVEGLPQVTRSSSPIHNLATFTYAGRKETVDELNRIVKELETVVNDSSISLAAKRARLDAINASIGDEHAILMDQFEGISDSMVNIRMRDVELEATRIMLAIEEYEAQHGRLPESLDELTPEIVEDLPVVPVTGNAFGYRVLDEPDAVGRRYLLYVVGAGGVDNGGRHLTPDTATLPDLLMDESLGEQYDWIANDTRP